MDDLFYKLVPWAYKASRTWCLRHSIPARLHEDCIQEAIISAWKATKKVKPGSSVQQAKTFVLISIVGAIKDSMRREAPSGYRSKKKKNWSEISLIQQSNFKDDSNREKEPWDVADSHSREAFDLIDTRDEFTHVMSLLKGRELIVWILLSRGTTIKQTAKIVGVSTDYMYRIIEAIKERVNRGRKG